MYWRLRPPAGGGTVGVYVLKAILLMVRGAGCCGVRSIHILPQDMYADLRPFVQFVGAPVAAGAVRGRHRRAPLRGAAISGLPATGACPFAPGLCGRRRSSDQPCGPLCMQATRSPGITEVFLIGAVLLLAALADGQPARRHLLPCTLQFAYRGRCCATCRCRREDWRRIATRLGLCSNTST